MRNLLLAAVLSCLSLPAMASCDSLKASIDAKLQAKGIASYTLEIVSIKPSSAATPAASGTAAAPTQEQVGKVVGTCDGDTKQIIYTRN